ncbi:GNAT family N-acetyltransferase [Aquibacillus saliphilus]|uniref:GNAT family N-acetyltransferase n=1 Tax=Aquibacillus saliphilus TaxID=1909422 RepID=UPI001CF09FA4
MLLLKNSRIVLIAIDLKMGQLLLNNREEFHKIYNIPLRNQFPSNGLRSLLPYYLERLDNNNDELGFGPWLVKDKYHIIGELGLKNFLSVNNTVDLGYNIYPLFRGNGYASEAVFMLCDWLFNQNVTVVTASCDIKNAPSIKVLKNSGFRNIGLEKNFILFEKRCSKNE